MFRLVFDNPPNYENFRFTLALHVRNVRVNVILIYLYPTSHQPTYTDSRTKTCCTYHSCSATRVFSCLFYTVLNHQEIHCAPFEGKKCCTPNGLAQQLVRWLVRHVFLNKVTLQPYFWRNCSWSPWVHLCHVPEYLRGVNSIYTRSHIHLYTLIYSLLYSLTYSLIYAYIFTYIHILQISSRWLCVLGCRFLIGAALQCMELIYLWRTTKWQVKCFKSSLNSKLPKLLVHSLLTTKTKAWRN